MREDDRLRKEHNHKMIVQQTCLVRLARRKRTAKEHSEATFCDTEQNNGAEVPTDHKAIVSCQEGIENFR